MARHYTAADVAGVHRIRGDKNDAMPVEHCDRLDDAVALLADDRADTIADSQRPTHLASGASTTYALGWTVTSTRIADSPVRVVSQRGSPAGGTVSLLAFPERGVAVAAAANVTDAEGVGPFALEVAEAFSR